MCVCFPEMTLCCQQDIKTQLLATVCAVTSHSRLFDSHEKDFGYVVISVNAAVSS